MDESTSKRPWVIAAAVGAAGLLTGAVLAGTLAAQAADNTPTPSPSASNSAPNSDAPPDMGPMMGDNDGDHGQPPNADPSRPMRSDEKLLTGDTRAKVEAAVMAKYPGATIERTESDSEGVYESHIVTTDGQHLIVLVGKDFTVTGTQECAPGGPRHGGPGMGDMGSNDGDGPQGRPGNGQPGDGQPGNGQSGVGQSGSNAA